MKKKSMVWSLGIVGLLVLGLFMSQKAEAPNRRAHDHIGQFNFKVEIEGVTGDAKTIVGGFKSVSGMDSETEVIEYQDGEDKTIRKRPGRTKYSNIVLKRGYADKSMEELWQWRKAVMDGKVERKSGSVIRYNRRGEELLRYNFFGAWPSKWRDGDLDVKGADASEKEFTSGEPYVELVIERADIEIKKLPRPKQPFPNLNYELLIEGRRVGVFEDLDIGLETEVIEYKKYQKEEWEKRSDTPTLVEEITYLNQYGEEEILRKRPGRTKYSNITLKRGYTVTDDLWLWRKNIEDGIIDRRSGTITVLDHDGATEVARWNFYEGWPCKWYVPDMDSDSSAMAIEKIEIAVEKVERAK